ncbi:hypothetical protein FUAX_02600 [Fulvitalea axinellae]|uniref:Cysteine-rich CWC n=1 Tax=Fulvitalea axinellae TaxID=1182444 RepID=A0AAU9CDH1_9BACT|nr:hypothetical protein FUAX_02600 [Fulvitalea axinellae]
MPRHEDKKCPRCGAGFECKTGSVTICQCYAVPLNTDEREYIREKFDDCLCARCLAQLKQEFHDTGNEKTVSDK